MSTCIICKSHTLKEIKIINGYKILECKKCSLAITEGKGSPNLNELYRDSNLYKPSNYLFIERQQYHKFLKIYKHLKKTFKRGRILEVGAGFGILASILSNDKNYTVEVVEPYVSPIYIKKNKKIIIHKETYENFLKNNQRKYDCIIFIDVLEHFKDPEDIISKSKKVLNPNGILLINLPNYKSLMARVVKSWSWWMVEDHYYHFSPKSISKFLENNGFQLISITSYEQFIDFKKNIDGNFSHVKNKFKRKIFKAIFLLIFSIIYFFTRNLFWKFGYGGLMLVNCKRNTYE